MRDERRRRHSGAGRGGDVRLILAAAAFLGLACVHAAGAGPAPEARAADAR